MCWEVIEESVSVSYGAANANGHMDAMPAW
jgi:hypothetical protein